MSNFENSPQWPGQEEAFSQIAAEVKKIIETKISGSFDDLLNFSKEENPNITEIRLIREIIQAGEDQSFSSEDYEDFIDEAEESNGEQKLEGDGYEEKVIIGYIALAGQYGLIE